MTFSVVVTGARGFLGHPLVAYLAGRSIPTIAVTRVAADFPVDVSHVRVKSYADCPVPEDAVLIHLAEPAMLGDTASKGDAHIREMTGQMDRLLDLPWRRIVYASSGAVYRDRRPGLRSPIDTVNDGNPYAAAKLANEERVLKTGRGVVARLANVYGATAKPGTVIGDIMAQIPGTGPLIVRDSRPARDFVWADDAAAALAAFAGGRATGVFNVGTGTAVSINDIARKLLALAGEDERTVTSISANNEQEDQGPNSLALGIDETTRRFGWRPGVTIDVGLNQIWEAAQ